MASINTSGTRRTQTRTTSTSAAGIPGATGTPSGPAPQRTDNASTPTDKVSLGSGPSAAMEQMNKLRQAANAGLFSNYGGLKNSMTPDQLATREEHFRQMTPERSKELSEAVRRLIEL